MSRSAPSRSARVAVCRLCSSWSIWKPCINDSHRAQQGQDAVGHLGEVVVEMVLDVRHVLAAELGHARPDLAGEPVRGWSSCARRRRVGGSLIGRPRTGRGGRRRCRRPGRRAAGTAMRRAAASSRSTPRPGRVGDGEPAVDDGVEPERGARPERSHAPSSTGGYSIIRIAGTVAARCRFAASDDRSGAHVRHHPHPEPAPQPPPSRRPRRAAARRRVRLQHLHLAVRHRVDRLVGANRCSPYAIGTGDDAPQLPRCRPRCLAARAPRTTCTPRLVRARSATSWPRRQGEDLAPVDHHLGPSRSPSSVDQLGQRRQVGGASPDRSGP